MIVRGPEGSVVELIVRRDSESRHLSLVYENIPISLSFASSWSLTNLRGIFSVLIYIKLELVFLD